MPLLAEHETPAFKVENAQGKGRFFFVCEHASNYVPEKLNGLGLSQDDLNAHIAWDPGALKLAQALSKRFDSPLVSSRISRLVYDCNRPPVGKRGMPEISEDTVIPGNQHLDTLSIMERTSEVYLPFRNAIAETLAQHLDERPPLFVTIHSFTPIFKGETRTLEMGILHTEQSTRLADSLLKHGDANELVIERNAPYSPSDGVMHTVEEHALANHLENAMIEVRNDLLQDDAGINRICQLLGDMLEQAAQEF